MQLGEPGGPVGKKRISFGVVRDQIPLSTVDVFTLGHTLILGRILHSLLTRLQLNQRGAHHQASNTNAIKVPLFHAELS